MDSQFDLVVIGGGPGGYGAALYATSAGLKVALVEKDTIGGTCLNRGCIPAKAFLETAAVQRHVAHAAEFGIEAWYTDGQLRRCPSPQTEDRRRDRQGPLRADEVEEDHHRRRCRFTRAEPHRHCDEGRRHLRNPLRHQRAAGFGFGAANDPRFRAGAGGCSGSGDDQRRGTDAGPRAWPSCGHRRRRHRMRVRQHLRRPRRPGHDPRRVCPRSCPGWTPTSPTSSCAASRRSRSTSAPG